MVHMIAEKLFEWSNGENYNWNLAVAKADELLKWIEESGYYLAPFKVEDFVEVSDGVFQCARCPEMFLTQDKSGYYSVNNHEREIFKFEVKDGSSTAEV